MLRERSRSIVLPIALLLVLSAAGCRPSQRGEERLAEDSSAAQDIDSNLTFDNITLEQADEAGKPLWKVKAEQAVYTPDKAVAKVTNPNGQLYQDGQAVYRIQADRGEVRHRQSGNRIFLMGNVVATDTKSGAVIQGDELEWRPEQDILVIRKNLRGSHPQVKLSADEAKLFNRQRRMELSGKQAVAITTNPDLQIQAEHLVWLMDQKKIESDRPVLVQRLQNKKVTDQANGNRASVNLETKTVKLTQNARVISLDPPIQVTSNSLLWNLQDQTLISDQPITAIHRQQQVTLTADRGRVNMEPRIAYFTGNVKAVGDRNQSNLTADNLTWKIPSQQIEAEGNVFYTQAANPPLTLRGPRAVGRLENRVIVVSGGQVVTEIIPERVN